MINQNDLQLSLAPSEKEPTPETEPTQIPEEIDGDDLDQPLSPMQQKLNGKQLPEDEESLDSYLETVERNAIVAALETTRWNKTAAAKLLGITFRALRYKLKKLDLE